MNVDVLQTTPNADRLVVACGRGDYMQNSLVGVDLTDDEQYREIVEDVSIDHDYTHLDVVTSEVDEKVANMVHKLINRGHWGICEHASITFAVEGVSRSCMSQITRHRLISFDVQSMRYVNVENADVFNPDTFEQSDVSMDIEADNAFESYTRLLDQGVPKEDARMVLPIGTKVNLTMTMNLRTLAHVINLRKKANAQHEIRELATKLIDEARDCAPITVELISQKMPMQISP